jgi:hypothetical protein
VKTSKNTAEGMWPIIDRRSLSPIAILGTPCRLNELHGQEGDNLSSLILVCIVYLFIYLFGI